MTARNLALEALYAGKEARTFSERLKAHALGRAAISALEAETGEPVAWIEPNDLAMLLKGKGREEFAGMRFAGVSDKQSKITSTALYAAPPPAVPPGWKLVPIEPTEAMWKAGLAHLFRDVDAVWKAMLAEVPEAPK